MVFNENPTLNFKPDSIALALADGSAVGLMVGFLVGFEDRVGVGFNEGRAIKENRLVNFICNKM